MISIVRLKDLFAPMLNMKSIDQRASSEQQIQQFVADDSAYLAVTQDRKYTVLVRRIACSVQ